MQENVQLFTFSMALKMSEQASTGTPAVLQAAVITAFVSALFENISALKAIAAIDYRDLLCQDR
jgi:hypothetical protein